MDSEYFPLDLPDEARSQAQSVSVPENVQRLTLFEEAIKEAHRHKWIESEKAHCDLGDEAIRDWHKQYWRAFVRERWIQHLRGQVFWVELDNDDFGLLNRRFHDNTRLVDAIIERLTTGGENLDVVQWALERDYPMDEVLEVLGVLDINSRRISPAIALDEDEFVEGMKAQHHPRVLIVDDDGDTRQLLEELFRAEQMETLAVGSGEDAFEEVQKRRFDLFLIDIMLPGKHGAEVAWYLRRHGVSCPIIAISAVLDTWNEDDLFDCGFTRLMGKPFDLEELRSIARQTVEAVANE